MRPHLSPTQLDMACRCGEQYRRRYIEGEIIPPNIAMAKGTGLHRAAETNMRQKLESHRDLPLHDIVAAAVDAFEIATSGGLTLLPEETGRVKQAIGEAKDAVVDMARTHARKQAPEYQPTMVEERVLLELPGPYDLMGVIDLADDQGRVTDFKTSKRKKRQADVDESIQLTTYAAAYEVLTGTPPKEVRFDTLVTTAKGCDRQLLRSTRDRRDIAALCHRINAVSAAVQGGNYMPAVPGSWWCSSKWCGYSATCKFFVDRGLDSGEE